MEPKVGSRWRRLGSVSGLIAIAAGVLLSQRQATVPEEAWAAPDAASVSGAIAFFERRLREDPGNAVFMASLPGR